MNTKQHILHWIGTAGVVLGILSSPLVSHFLPAETSSIIAAVSYALKQLAPLFGDTQPTQSGQ